MPTTLIVGDKIETRAITLAQNQLGINVCHWNVEAIAGIDTLEAFTEFMEALLAPLYKPLMSAEAEWRGLGARVIDETPPGIEVFANAEVGPGTDAGELLPTQVCGILTKKTLLAGRKFRGRVYLPFPAETVNDSDGNPTAGYLINANLLGDELEGTVQLNDGAAGTIDVGAVLRSGDGAGGFIYTSIDQCFARPRWATQRKRGAYGQKNTSPI